MNVLDQIVQWFLGLGQAAFGFLLGSMIGGWYTWKVVVPKIMKNPTIQKLAGFFKSKEAQEYVGLFREGIVLLKEAMPLLKKVVENQENHKNGED